MKINTFHSGADIEGGFLETLRELPLGETIRIDKKLAKKWLLEDKSIICGGLVFHFWIRDIGLGVCEVAKASLTREHTYFVRK